ncbi:MAG: UDP-N-acetylmuramoyl-L-alanine--D-glutamate ligase [Planctomycetota bacterium]
MTPDHFQRDYRDLQILVMGLGSFGGGSGVVRFLATRGAQVTVTDTRPADKLADALQELNGIPSLKFKLGAHDFADFQHADLVVANPAVRRDNVYLGSASAAGVPITSEMNLFWQWNPAQVVAVTGSNGKSTTTALIHSILKNSGRTAWLGGNIGVSLLPEVHQIRPNDIVVLELSSFQLTDLDRLQASPAISVITNFAPNHLDWHDTLDHYRWAKQTMLRWQKPTDAAILNAEDADVSSWDVNGERLMFGIGDYAAPDQFGAFSSPDRHARIHFIDRDEDLPLSDWLKLPGRHNLANALAASCAAVRAGASLDAVREGIVGYQPLPHRLQWIADIDGRSFYNDSLATTPESAIVGLQAFDRPVILLAGGYDKQVDLTEMGREIARRAKGVALMGQTSAALRRIINAKTGHFCHISPELRSFREAFDWAVSKSSSGDVILLSPGCASYDWFRNFADRGSQFEEFVRSLAGIAKNDGDNAG